MVIPATPTLDNAISLYRAGQLDAAEAACRAILQLRPRDPDTLNLLGMITAQGRRLDASEESFRKALERAPNRANILCNLAESIRLQGRHAEALPLLRRAVSLSPTYPNAHIKLAVTLLETGRIDEAIAVCRAGLIHLPKDPGLHGLAAELLIDQHKPDEATPHLLVALELAPNVDLHWRRLYRLLTLGALAPRRGRPFLIRALSHPAIRPTMIAGSIASTLCMDPFISALIQESEQGTLPSGQALMELLVRLSSDTLLIALMEATVIPSPPLERLFISIRRSVLESLESANCPPEALPFFAALAMQSFHTDYAWQITQDEEAIAERLAARLDEAMECGSDDDRIPLWLTLVGACQALYRCTQTSAILAREWPAALTALLRIQVREPLEEHELRTRIPELTEVRNPVSREVQAQYEENPYPRWVRAERPARTPLPDLMRSLGAEIPADPSFNAPDVLIAGCGTGQHAIVSASYHDKAKVLAVDLSRASLAYALRKTRELGISNIEYRHGDITELKGFDRRFHVIECSGVLVCIDDPMAAWRILTDLLHPGGLMNIGLYSETARRTIVAGRAYIAEHGYPATTAGIRSFRKDFLDLPDQHPLASLKSLRDLYSISDCRDLLFHVKEHRFTIPQIKNALDQLGLRFLRFSLKDTSGYRQRFPDDPRMTSLDNWHAFEQSRPDTFVDMYQFWVQKP